MAMAAQITAGALLRLDAAWALRGWAAGAAAVLGGWSARIAAPAWDFLGAILLAAPKKRTTHRTKRIRLAPKWQKPLQNIAECPVCGTEKRLHHICPNCLRELRRSVKDA